MPELGGSPISVEISAPQTRVLVSAPESIVFGQLVGTGGNSGGSGAVASVNGQVGAVTLDATDVGAETPAGAQAKVDTASTSDRARANHTGVQAAATISDFTEAVQDAVASLLTSGANVTLTYDDSANSLTVTAAGDDAEAMRDTIGAALVGVGAVAVTVNDAGDTITISTTATVNSTDAQLRDRSTHTGTQPANTVTGLADVATTGSYTDLTNKPATFAPSAHTHLAANITDLSKTSVGLGNVDNTADTAKPVSTAQQAALDAKANIAVQTVSVTSGPNVNAAGVTGYLAGGLIVWNCNITMTGAIASGATLFTIPTGSRVPSGVTIFATLANLSVSDTNARVHVNDTGTVTAQAAHGNAVILRGSFVTPIG